MKKLLNVGYIGDYTGDDDKGCERGIRRLETTAHSGLSWQRGGRLELLGPEA